MYPVLFLLLLLFAHFVGDYTHASTKWMLDAKRIGYPYLPIAAHALVHAILIAGLCNLYTGCSISSFQYDVCDTVFIIEFVTHFVIDVLKGKCNVWFPSVSLPQNKQHWYLFGIDQFLHQAVIVYIWFIVNSN